MEPERGQLPPSPPPVDKATDKKIGYANWTPPPQPPPDLINVAGLEDFLTMVLFKKDDPRGLLYDETGTVNLPANEKGMLILDPESRYRIEDAFLDFWTMERYEAWTTKTKESESLDGELKRAEWLRGLLDNVREDAMDTSKEFHDVMDEERRKRGLTGFEAYIAFREERDRKLFDASEAGA